MDLASPNRKRSRTGLTAGVLLQDGIPNEVKVEKCDSAGFLPAQSCEILRVGVSSWCAPNLNIFGSFGRILKSGDVVQKTENFYLCQD